MASLTDSDRNPVAEPDDERRKRLLKEAEDLANTTRRLLYVLISAGFFLMLTLSVPDSDLVRADARISWPLIHTEVELTTFLTYGPPALVALAIYLHLHLERLIELCRRGFPPPETYIFVMPGLPARIVADFLLYAYVPLILAWFSWKAVFREEASLLIAATLIVALLSALLYYARAVDESRIRRRIGLGALGALSVLTLSGVLLVAIRSTEPILRLRQIDLAHANIGVTEEFPRVELVGIKLNHADMSRATLSGADLRRADLSNTSLDRATLGGGSLEEDARETDFGGASLDGASILAADLRNATFACATLRDADLSQSVLGETSFRGADLTRADFTRALNPGGTVELQAANLTGAKFNFTFWDSPNFAHARLTEAESDGAVFPGASFFVADLRGARLYNGDYTGAIFINADLTGADLSAATLTGATFSGANLTDADLTGASGADVVRTARLCRTIMPDGTVADDGCAKEWRPRTRERACYPGAPTE